MGSTDRIVRTLMGAAMVYVSFVNSDIIGDTLLNAIVGMFGIMNIVSSLTKVCPAYLLIDFSTQEGLELRKSPGSTDTVPSDETVPGQPDIVQTENISTIRRKLQLSVALPMIALLGIFGTIVLDLNHQFQMSNITRQMDVAAGIAANFMLAHVGSTDGSDNLESESPAHALSVVGEAISGSALFVLHDSQANILPSPFDRGLENTSLVNAFRDSHANAAKIDQRGMLAADGLEYVWTTTRVGTSDTWFTAFMLSPSYHDMFDQFLSIRFMVIIFAVMWMAIWTSSYIVRKFLEKIQDSAALLNYRTTHDMLTGLPNRLSIEKIIADKAETLDTDKERIVLLLVDIISFRDINDTLGYSLGDELLVEVGRQLSEIDPDSTTVVRMGGDVFCLVCQSSLDETNASRLSNAVHDRLERSHELNGVPVAVQVRIGISSYPVDSLKAEELIRFADIALAQAKSQRLKNNYYQHELDTHSIRKLTLLSRLRSVIEQDELSLVFQPKIDIQDNTIVGVEALVRWTDAQYGPVSPMEFINWAEKSGLIDKLTRWVLQSADKQCGEWRVQGYDIPFAVNLSPTNLYDSRLIPLVSQLVEEGNFGGGMLELEITENAVMEDPERALRTMNVLNSIGVSFSIDDFGTGLSSFTYLRKFPVSNLKIDRIFISDSEENDRDAILLQSMIELGHSLGCVVTAEGVEDQDSLEKLRNYRCDYIQGFHVCKPLPADELIRWLNSSTWGAKKKAA